MMRMTIFDAQVELLNGAKFGDVYPALVSAGYEGEMLDKFRSWYCRDPRVPTRPTKPDPPPSPNGQAATVADRKREAKSMGYSGDPCPQCYALKLKPTGPCFTCDNCGMNTGC